MKIIFQFKLSHLSHGVYIFLAFSFLLMLFVLMPFVSLAFVQILIAILAVSERSSITSINACEESAK